MTGRTGTRLAPDERRAQLLGCAVRLFGAHGYAGVSLGEVAEAAGVARGLVNHYFGTKRALYLEVVRVLVTIPDDALEELDDLAGAALEARVDAAVTWFLDAVGALAAPWTAVGAGGHDRDVAAVVAEADERTVEAVLRLAGVPLEGHPDATALRAAGRAYVAFARRAAVEWLVSRALTRDQAHLVLAATLVQLLRETVPRLGDAAVSPRRSP